jgi:hypothetical protein
MVWNNVQVNVAVALKYSGTGTFAGLGGGAGIVPFEFG